MKVLLRKTKQSGEDENEEDAKWFDQWESELPEEPMAPAVVMEETEEAASPLCRVLRNAKQALAGKKDPSGNPFPHHSTPELTN